MLPTVELSVYLSYSARYFVPFVDFCKKDLTRWCEDFLSPILENKVFLDTSVEVGVTLSGWDK